MRKYTLSGIDTACTICTKKNFLVAERGVCKPCDQFMNKALMRILNKDITKYVCNEIKPEFPELCPPTSNCRACKLARFIWFGKYPKGFEDAKKLVLEKWLNNFDCMDPFYNNDSENNEEKRERQKYHGYIFSLNNRFSTEKRPAHF